MSVVFRPGYTLNTRLFIWVKGLIFYVKAFVKFLQLKYRETPELLHIGNGYNPKYLYFSDEELEEFTVYAGKGLLFMLQIRDKDRKDGLEFPFLSDYKKL